MQKYYEIIYSNGFCGCDEEEYVKCDEKAIDEYAIKGLYNSYGFSEPDSRFMDEEDYESYEDMYEDYIQNYLYVEWEEITKEEYEENKID